MLIVPTSLRWSSNHQEQDKHNQYHLLDLQPASTHDYSVDRTSRSKSRLDRSSSQASTAEGFGEHIPVLISVSRAANAGNPSQSRFRLPLKAMFSLLFDSSEVSIDSEAEILMLVIF